MDYFPLAVPPVDVCTYVNPHHRLHTGKMVSKNRICADLRSYARHTPSRQDIRFGYFGATVPFPARDSFLSFV